MHAVWLFIWVTSQIYYLNVFGSQADPPARIIRVFRDATIGEVIHAADSDLTGRPHLKIAFETFYEYLLPLSQAGIKAHAVVEIVHGMITVKCLRITYEGEMQRYLFDVVVAGNTKIRDLMITLNSRLGARIFNYELANPKALDPVRDVLFFMAYSVPGLELHKRLDSTLMEEGIGDGDVIILVPIEDAEIVFTALGEFQSKLLTGFKTANAMCCSTHCDLIFQAMLRKRGIVVVGEDRDHFKVTEINFSSVGSSRPWRLSLVSCLPVVMSKRLFTRLDWECLGKLRSLKKLDVSDNALAGTVDLALLPRSLEVLNLSGNRLIGALNFSCLPPALRVLDLGLNQFYGIVDFAVMPYRLKVILLSNNNFTQFEGVQQLSSKLQRLEIQKNAVIDHWTSMRRVNVSEQEDGEMAELLVNVG